MTSATLNASVNPNGFATTYQFTSDFGTFEVQSAGSGTAAVAVSITVGGLAPGRQYRFNVTATNAYGTTQGVEQTFTTLARTRFANIATRLRVETGDNVLIGGFIVTGTQPKRLIIRAIGPTLGVEGALQNPQLAIYRGEELLVANDNWRDAPNQQEIIDSTVAPANDLESAVLLTLEPGAYTAVVSGVDGETGVGSVEAYDLDAAADSTFANISTRGFVQTGADAMFGGLIITGSSPQKVILRAIGPSLGIAAQLEDPLLELYDTEGNLLTVNNNWRDTQQAEIEATTIPPSNDLESAIVAILPPAAYTAIVRGVSDTTGVALVEVYALQ